MNGVLVHVEQALSEGSLCNVRIQLGDSMEDPCVIEAHGKVARQSGQSMAIEFVDVDVDGFSHLKNLVMFNTVDKEKVEREFAGHLGIRHE